MSAAALILATVLTLLLTLFTFESSQLTAAEPECRPDRAPAAAVPCARPAVAVPERDRHPGHHPFTVQVCPVATATHRTLCHTLLPAVAFPATGGPAPAVTAPAPPAPGTTADCPPRTDQRQILRC
ncbi:hypothetical protein FM076_31165 [Streptomyces albus subsp. chlorinus]|uniref:hypothetical protein n=1 Tax=Streptomyces albus TaxID=1888 RepID=UPI00156ECD66|nr:hypothetical protein [Streptomyces albus]NSC25373.1 hypothetical protein [Streptomyces albus subsp. chlorinus]